MLPRVAIDPARHDVHLVAPATEIFPTVHGIHASPTPYWPAGHIAANVSDEKFDQVERGSFTSNVRSRRELFVLAPLL